MAISKRTIWFAKVSLMVLAIYLGSTYLVHYALSPSSPVKEGTAPKRIKQSPADEARFQASFSAGKEAFSDGLYTAALDKFLEAERSTAELTDDQYNALKQARLQIALAYESSADNGAANTVYRALADCANKGGNELYKEKNFEAALARAQDAEQFTDHLSDGRRDALLETTSLLVGDLLALHRHKEAALAQEHWIEFLNTSADNYDQAFVQAYMSLEGIYADEKDWHGVEQALTQTIEACDRIHSHFTAENNTPFVDPTVPRNWSQYNLVIAYYQEGDTGTALSRAEDFFTEYSQNQQDTSHPVSITYHASDFAALALQIATEAKRQNDIDLWQKRAPGGITTIALHPLSTP